MMPLPGTWWLTTLLVLPFGYTQAQSGTGQVVTAIHTSTATVLLDCTCTQTFSRPLTKHGISTTSDLDATLTSTPIISHPDVPPAGSEKSADPAFVGTSGKESSFPSARESIPPICPLYRLRMAHLPIRVHPVGLSDSNFKPYVHSTFPSANRLYLGMPTQLSLPT